MKRICKIGLILPLLILLSSCSDDAPEQEPFPDESYVYNPDSISDIAKALVNLQPNIEMCNEVHAATQKAISLGLDESYYFIEILGMGERITKTSEIRRSILSKIESLPDTNHIKQLYSKISGDSHYMRHYQIYWPYSQKWDGNEMPTITYKTKESPLLPQHENTGYRLSGDGVETVTVDERYAKQHPVWIINYNPIPYEEYPDFAQQNWVSKIFDWYDFEDYYKEGEILTQKIIVYAKENKSLYNRPDYAKASMVDTKNDTLSLYLKSVTFDKKDRRLHSLFSGGAHYIFNIQLTDINDINYLDYGNSGNSKYYKKWFYNTELVGVRFVYLRSEMTEGSVKTLDNLMSWHWLPYEYSFPVTLIQEFGGDKYIFIEDILYYVYYGPYYAFLEEREPNIGNFGMSLVGFMPLQINDELLYHSDYARYSGRMYSEGMIYYEDYVVSEYLTCELDVTKGMSIPSWYTPTAQ